MKRAIVTGANGFIGNAVCQILLAHNISVIAIVRDKQRMRRSEDNNLFVVEAELNEYLNLADKLPRGVDVFYHFAWDGAYGAVLGNYKKQIENIRYTCDAINLAKQIGCAKFIMAGTINELELFQFYDADKNIPRRACIYGIAKLAGDFMGKTLAADWGMNFNVAVIGSCFGPGDNSERIHNTVISKLMKGESPVLIRGDTLHDWVYIDDVARMFFALGTYSVNMKNYYLGHRNLRRLDEIVADVRDEINPKIKLVFGEIQSSFYIDYSLVDLEALYQDTGCVATADFKESIRITAEWLAKKRG
jgi:nucleoside-diphosphate-sugar epimerase